MKRCVIDMADRSIIIGRNTTLFEALQLMDKLGKRLLIICDGDFFIGLVSIGDIQRAIIRKIDLSDCVMNHIRGDILYAKENDSTDYIMGAMKKERIESMPIVDAEGKLVQIIGWDDLFNNEKCCKSVGCPVVIMAGGKGERLKPLTNLIPKPLIPVSDKTIIEEIMDVFLAAACEEFIISINYKADEIEKYFSEHKDINYNISFIREGKPLGTGGALALLRGSLQKSFFVSNCDVLVDINLSDLFEYHVKAKNIATIVSVIKSFSIPYGIIETREGGILTDIKEKPNLSYQFNSGLYLLEPEIFRYVDDGESIDLPDMLKRAKNIGENIGVFPVPEGSWRDMGNWHEYLNMIQNHAPV